ncbi:DNA-processing protein DprA [Bacillus atrophaeus]|uniref:DNA-processing protein DprA n=1 Tax=Bacillus atrophaeus TaxID=1452 RepID=UPI00227E739C|nr:DNA-processing protein DprA [Bacillus atrophaeus]MCY8932303.1 DNA-protecting protein DprA [Bacillus atrophaeus]MCY8940990.1 DNA-protecting protein DprA [Bacillus atrophaeus]MCY8947881.1 DNA-protecting protein DprA [Bacillus atrophaeus]
MSAAFWIALSNIEGMGVKTIKKLYTYFPNLTLEDLSINKEKISDTVKNLKILQKMLDEVYLLRKIEDAERQVKLHESKGIQVIDIASQYYPKLLRFIEDPPVVLYCKGNIELLKDDRKIAIVGTRNPTELGYKAAMKVSAQFCKRNFVVVSGLAVGIDTAGHKGAINVNGKTIAVLAGSLDKIYPKENTEFANEIIKRNGLLISETPLGGKTYRNSFVLRDRIQSGLSLGVCPVQTPLKGGTQHTIKFAQNQERMLFCPNPLEEREVEATQGIYHLLENRLASKIENESDYEKIIKSLANTLERLINTNVISRKEIIGYTKDQKIKQDKIEQLSFFDENSNRENLH